MGFLLSFKHTVQGVTRRTSLTLLTASLGLIVGVASSGAAVSHSARVMPSPAKAFAAKVLLLNMHTSTHLVGRPGHVLNEQGTVSGTFSGTVYVHFTSVTSTTGTATITVYTSGGSMSGRAITHGRVVGATAYFSGGGSITGGTGKWAHARGTGLQFSGTLDRRNFRATSQLQGKIHT